VAYALTFESQTLTADDIERVRSLSREIEKQNRTVSAPTVDSPS
jgi:hypothetical protein